LPGSNKQSHPQYPYLNLFSCYVLTSSSTNIPLSYYSVVCGGIQSLAVRAVSYCSHIVIVFIQRYFWSYSFESGTSAVQLLQVIYPSKWPQLNCCIVWAWYY